MVINQTLAEVLEHFDRAGLNDFGVTMYGTANYPQRLRDAKYPIELYYYQGNTELVFLHKSIAVIGSRKSSDDGLKRTRKLARLLTQHDFTIFSGLADGVDTEAHTTAIKMGGRTVAVIGTPLTEVYPKSNRLLQKHIADEHLVISQVPVLRYANQNYQLNRLFFPERNATMSALADATVIVEASQTSGTLIQARAALHQGRKLFILDSCFQNPNITWPGRFAKRVRHFEDILHEFEDGK